MSDETALRTALYTAVASFASDESLRVAWPNVAFDPGSDELYLRVAVLPVPPTQLAIKGDGALYPWLLQVSAYARDGVGELKPLAIIDALRTAFPANHRFAVGAHEAVVIAPATVPPPVSADGWFFIPAQFRIQFIS